MKLLAALCVFLLLAGCSPGETSSRDREPAASPSPPSSEEATPREPRPLSARGFVEDPAALLTAVRLDRRGQRVQVTSAWRHRVPGRYVVATSSDGFRRATYERVATRGLLAVTAGPQPRAERRPQPCVTTAPRRFLCLDQLPDGGARATVVGATGRAVADLDGGGNFLHQPVVSLDPDVVAFVSGGDGASLFPFEELTWSTDAGTTWMTVEAPTFGGARAYTDGQVVLPDGRLLVLLNSFSDDDAPRPAPRPHGLYVSTDSTWQSFEPCSTSGLPAPGSRVNSLGASASPSPILWVQRGRTAVLASMDGAMSFSAVRTR